MLAVSQPTPQRAAWASRSAGRRNAWVCPRSHSGTPPSDASAATRASLRGLGRVAHSTASAVANAIDRIRRGFRQSIVIADLARDVGMSVSAFHRQFKAVTGASPLQYQKTLRLLEARRVLRTGAASVSTAAYDVGYESPNQFSREYARTFGRPPKADVAAGLCSTAPPSTSG